MPPGAVRLPVPPGVVPLTFGEPTPDELSPPDELPSGFDEPPSPLDDEPPSPLEGVVSGIVAVPAVAFEAPEVLEPLDALEPAEAVEALDPAFIEALLPVVVLFRPPVVAVCAKMPSERPKKTALIILPSRSRRWLSDGDMKARPRIL
jgi:hypothetical protein